MTYRIYYARRFFWLEQGIFIPCVNVSSSTLLTRGKAGNPVPKHFWAVLQTDPLKLAYTREEMQELAQQYALKALEEGTHYKSKNRPFEPDEFARWILAGTRSAYTVEQYVSFGNRPLLRDFAAGAPGEDTAVRTTAQLIEEMQRRSGHELLVGFKEDRANVPHNRYRTAN